jgi:decaprenylphospho-beta-D-erythro-pentofuranosid-2-ulose 2-reductase
MEVEMKDALGEIQSALVLGGDSDIAAATLERLVRRRTRRVILAGRDLERLERRARHLRDIGATRVDCMAFDALDFGSHESFVGEVFQDIQDVDLVLLAFGTLGSQERDEHDGSKAVDVIQSNFTGAVSVLVPLADRLRAQGHGTIVVMSSVAAERARRSNFIYGASKAGLDWFSQGLGDALNGSGVRVMIVRPGFATTKMTAGLDTPPLASDADDVARAIIAGLRADREIVWVPGKLRWIMTVIRHLPRPIFRRLRV